MQLYMLRVTVTVQAPIMFYVISMPLEMSDFQLCVDYNGHIQLICNDYLFA